LQNITLLQIATLQIQKIKLIYWSLLGLKIKLYYIKP